MSVATNEPGGPHLLDAALGYAARGLLVLALVARGKRPLLAHGLLEASSDPMVIRPWWSRWPDANIGLRTGSESFHVLDVDGKEGTDQLRALVAEHGRLTRGPVARTPNGGYHLYFAPPSPKIGNRARFAPGLDWRGERGYVLVPPSVGANGKRYEWVRPL